ncbi:MAG TPA: GGDEF domain-containing protein [Thermoanaerobaculia bacterium]|nr:GGDEF domain-containing protein [Thermoanaerobaculia bacterium]
MPYKRRLYGTAAAAVAVAAIGWIDYVTGPDVALSLLYLIPVAIAGWYGGMTVAIFISAAAGTASLVANITWDASESAIAISMWNAFTRYVIYTSEAVLLAMLHRDREKLRRLVAHQSTLARTDSSTSLPNARAFMEVVEEEIQTARETGDPVCVAYLDLDNFKRINDTFGHAAGDEVLQRVAGALKRSIRGHDVAARLGGDEFAVLLRGVEPDAARTVGERIAARIGEIAANYAGAALGVTLGVAHFRAVPDNAATLLRAADGAMYAGKTSGKGRVIVQNL